MAKPFSFPLRLLRSLTLHLLPRPYAFIYLLALISLLSHLLSPRPAALASSSHHFEGFDAEDDADDTEDDPDPSSLLPSHSPPPTSLSSSSSPPSSSSPDTPSPTHSDPSPKPSSLPDWDADEFEGFDQSSSSSTPSDSTAPTASSRTSSKPQTAEEEKEDEEEKKKKSFPGSYPIEITCVSFLIAFAINYFTGKVENERIALVWAEKFATKDAIFVKNFSLLGTGDGSGDAPLLLKEGNDVFKFYASGRRFCQGMLATMEMRSRHDLISRILDLVMRKQDTLTFEVVLNDEAMDHVVFALARRKLARAMHKEELDLRSYAGAVASPPSGRKWVAEELMVVTESKEVAGDILTDAVLDQVFGEKSFEKFGKGFISMHFSDQLSGSRKKVLMFKFLLPDVNSMVDMSRLVALVPYYIDLIGRYKLSSQARSKTEAARAKVAHEAYRELQNARQEVLQKRKAEKKKLMEEAEAKLSAEALRKKEEKERARQLKKAMPKVKMLRS